MKSFHHMSLTPFPPFSSLWLISPSFLFSFSFLHAQNHPRPAVKAQSVQRAVKHVSWQIIVYLRNCQLSVWAVKPVELVCQSGNCLPATVFFFFLPQSRASHSASPGLINDALQGKFLIRLCCTRFAAYSQSATLSKVSLLQSDVTVMWFIFEVICVYVLNEMWSHHTVNWS